MSVPQIITGNSITVLLNGKTLVAKAGHPNFEAIKDYLKAGAEDVVHLASLFDIPKAIETKTEGAVVVRGNEVLYLGKPLHNTLTQRMLVMLNEGFDIQPLVNFLTRLMKNPSFRAVNGLYDFLAATNIPITPEGKFLAFKKVRDDYYDIHSGTIRNAVGDEPRVPRNQVDEDPDVTCSYGLHVCSEAYLPHFGSCAGNRVVIVEVDPEDVVAIPADYNNAKMRCAGYKVIGEVAQADAPKAFTSVVMSADDFDDEEEDEEGFYDDDRYEDDFLSDDPIEVIKDVDGVSVTFARDGEDWTAYWVNPDGDEVEAYVGCLDLDDAVESFREEHLDEVMDYSAEIRWLDEDGNLKTEKVTLTVEADYGQPADWEFLDEATTDDDLDTARVVNIEEVPGSVRKRGGWW